MPVRLKMPHKILSDMIANVRAGTAENPDPRQRITDFSRGSVARTILEASAMQDADLYLQIGALARMFSLDDAVGNELDERARDYDTERLSPEKARGYVRLMDERSISASVVETKLAADVNIGAMTITVLDASALPPSGAVVLDRGAVARELAPYSAKSGNTLTLTQAVTKAHAAGANVFLSLYGSDLVAGAGTAVVVPGLDIVFRTVEPATILDGDVTSPEVLAVSELPGEFNNVGSGQVVSFQVRPWPTAIVTNDRSFTGGRDREKDDAFRDRLRIKRQAKFATGLSIEAAALAVRTNNKRVVSAQLTEDPTGKESRLYLDDGNGTAAETGQQLATEILIHNAEAGQRLARLIHWPLTRGSLRLCVSKYRGGGESVTRGATTATIHAASLGLASNTLAGLLLVDDNRRIFEVQSNTANTIVVKCAPSEDLPSPFTWAAFDPADPLDESEYHLNETNGDVELVSSLVAGDVLLASPHDDLPAYSFYVGLIREVQRVINGDRSDRENYPGVKSSGVIVRVLAAYRREVSFYLSISSEFGVSESALVAPVKAAVEAYVNSLPVGGNVVLSKVIAAVLAVPGVADVRVLSPRSNVIVLEGQKARTSGDLIFVS